MKYLSGEIKREIREKYRNLRENSDIDYLCSICRDAEEFKIEKNAQVQSYRIEHPHEKIPFSIPRNRKSKYIKEGIEHIENAFNWGLLILTLLLLMSLLLESLLEELCPNYITE